MKIRQVLVLSIIATILVIIISDIAIDKEKNISTRFIGYKEQTDFNKEVSLDNFQCTYDAAKVLGEIEYKPLSIVYTPSGIITIYKDSTGNNKIDVIKTNEIESLNVVETSDSYVITQSEYIHNILDILKGSTDNIDKYFEKDVITSEIKDWLTNNLKEDVPLCLYIGKSKNNLNYIDRLVITEECQNLDSDIKIKVFLKLNKLQRVYDIDIY